MESQSPKPKTVRDIKELFEETFGRNSGNWNDSQRELWEKLNRLGGRNMSKIPPETVPDIDATVELNEEEIIALEEEIQMLQ